MPRRPSKPLRRKPSQSRSRNTVDAILEAAAQVFERHGYADATTDRIAARAGVSIGSLYQYFGDKRALLVAVAERHLDEGFATVTAALVAPDGTPPTLAATLPRVVRALVALHERSPNLHRVLFEEAPLPRRFHAALARREAELVRFTASVLAAERPAGVRDPALAAYLLVQTVDALAHRVVIHPPPDLARDQVVDEITRMLARYLAPEVASSTRRRVGL